jgi:peptide/nickel transport system substrate-binding protein
MKKLFLILFSVIIVCILIISGCSTSSSSSTAPSTAPKPAPASSTAAAPPISSAAPAPAPASSSAPATKPLTAPSSAPATTSAAAGGPQTGGTLRIGSNEGFVNIGDPRVSRVPNDGFIRQMFIEELLRFDKDGNIIPWLATEWKYTNDFKTVTFTLKQGVKYHDGTAFNSQSVKDNLDAYIAAKMPQFATVTSIEVVDESHVRLNTSSYDSSLLGILAQTPAGQMISPAAIKKYNADQLMNTPVGTGPFKLDSYDPGNKIVASRFADYWIKGQPYLDKIEVTYIKDPTVAKMSFERGEIDGIPRIDPPQGTDLLASGKYKNMFVSPAGFEFMLAGDSVNADSPWSKLKVRQAAMYAVDVDAMVKKLGQGVGVVCRRMFQANSPFYNPKPVPYNFDPAKAKALLAEAGYASGFTTTIYLRSPQYQDWAVTVQSYLNDVGIKSTIQVMTPAVAADVTAKGWKNGLLEILGPNTAEREAAITMLTYYGPGNTYNASVSLPKDVIDLCNQALVQPDMKKRVDLSVQADALLIDRDALYMNYTTIPFIVAKQTWLHDDNWRFFVGHYWTPEKMWIEKH